jgi:DNA-binding IclR family transcriptional regulator
MKNTISPEILMMRSIGGMIVPLTIKSALELDLFRVIASGVTNVQSLATTLQLNPSALQRLLRALVVMGLLTETPESSGNYSLTDTG